MGLKTTISEQVGRDFLFGKVLKYLRLVSKWFGVRFQGNPTFDSVVNSIEILLRYEQLDLNGHITPLKMDLCCFQELIGKT